MSASIRKCVSLGLNVSFGNPPLFEHQAHNFGPAPGGTNTPWVKIWADWARLQPDADPNDSKKPKYPIGTPTSPTSDNWGALDGAITAANCAGLKVLLTAHYFPSWATGATAPQAGTDKSASLRIPRDLSPTSYWAQWITHLLGRYNPLNPDNRGVIHALEICNEPNGELWPQVTKNASGGIVTTMQCAQPR